MSKTARVTAALMITFVAGVMSATFGAARAEQPAVDRALFERLVRAEEAQARQLEALTRATERCKR